MQDNKKTIRAELLATARSALNDNERALAASRVRSDDVGKVAVGRQSVYAAVGRVLSAELRDLRRAELTAEGADRVARIERILSARERLIDDAFIQELEPCANEYAVVAGDFIMSVGKTPNEAAADYAATGLDVRQDGSGGWEALSVSDRDWQPVTIIEISAELAAHIRQHGAPGSWSTIHGVAHLERAAA